MDKNHLVQSLKMPFLFVVAIWVVHLATYGLGLNLTEFGIYPRRWEGTKGILFYAFIHGDFSHLLSNTTPLFVLSAMILFFYNRVAWPAFLMIYFLSGIAVWMFARPAYHIGASGFIYGMVAFVFWTGVFRRNIKSIALALIVVFYYGSMILGVLPINPTVSWEGHLFGALAGIIVSYWFMDMIEPDEKRQPYSWEHESQTPPQYFLDRDTFEQTKSERNRTNSSDDNDFSIWTTTRS